MRDFLLPAALALAVSAPLSAPPAHAQGAPSTAEQADAALDRKDYATARPLLRQLAEAGNGEAALALAQLEGAGLGAPANPGEAARWLKLAAESGSPKGKLYWGRTLLTGEYGVAADKAAAERWLKSAADSGTANSDLALIAEASAELGRLYYERGNFTEALRRFDAGANAGSSFSLACKGAMLAKGEGAAQDQIRAAAAFATLAHIYADDAANCLMIAAQAGNAEAQFLAARFLLSSADAQAQAEGVGWLEKAAASDHSPAMTLLGEGSETGRWGLARDPARARALYSRASARGSRTARFAEARMQLAGEGGPRDATTALARLEQVAEQEPALRYPLGLIFAEGKLLPRDPAKAAQWMGRAAAEEKAAFAWLKAEAAGGTAAAQYHYGMALLAQQERNATEQAADKAAAQQWFRRAADQGHAGAMAALVDFIGMGATGYTPEAITLLTRAAEQGDPGAQRMLADGYEDGRLLPKDAAQAQRWYGALARSSSREAAEMLGSRAVFKGLWRHTALESGDAGALADTQRLYGEAIRWYKVAAERGSIEALWERATLHTKTGRDKAPIPGITDFAEARRLFLDYLRAGGANFLAARELSRYYANGIGGGVDRPRAYLFAGYQGRRAQWAGMDRDLRASMTPQEIEEGERMVLTCQLNEWWDCF